MNNKDFAYQYWSKTEFGRKMIESGCVSFSDLIFLIPNNVKKRYGLPLTRVSGGHKKEQKRLRKRIVLSWHLFEILEETIDNLLGSMMTGGEFINEFVDVKNIALGNKKELDANVWPETVPRVWRIYDSIYQGHMW